MANLHLTYVELYTRVSNFLGLTDYGTAPTSTDLTLCQDIVARGYRQFLYAVNLRTGKIHQWNFLKKFYTFTAIADKWKYAVPEDFSELASPIFFDSSELQPNLVKQSAEQILSMRSDVLTNEWPQFYAITPSTYDIELGTTYELWLYPTPDQNYTMNYFYRFDPLKLSATTDLTVGGIRVCEAILESCLGVAETQEEDNTSTHHQAEAVKLIQALITSDTITDTDKIGNLYSDRERQWPPQRPYLVNFSDDNIY